MTDLSQLVRNRMAKTPVAGPHPDADLLNAFAERSLVGREREGVLAHLATCADCREVVALAAPEAAQEAVLPARTRWLTLPVMRWGAVAAAVAVVAVAVVLQSPKMQQPSPSVRVADRSFVASAKPAEARPPSAARADAQDRLERSGGAERDRAGTKTKPKALE